MNLTESFVVGLGDGVSAVTPSEKADMGTISFLKKLTAFTSCSLIGHNGLGIQAAEIKLSNPVKKFSGIFLYPWAPHF